MKKIYTTFLFAIAFSAISNAQTIFNPDFSDSSYQDPAVAANLNDHADWVAGHGSSTSTWNTNTSNQILTGANFAYAVATTPIKAAVNDVITITTVVKLGFDNQAFKDVTLDMALIGLTPSIPVPGSGNTTALGNLRDGVIITENNNATTGNTADDFVSVKSAGGGSFATNPSVSQANKSSYEIIMEFTIGSSAATSSKKVRLKNVGATPETSTVATSTGIRSEIYDALTGATGAYYFNWSLGFFATGNEINRIVNSKVEIKKNTPLLSTKSNELTTFSTYPNPVRNVLNISTDASLQKVEVYDILGKTVLSAKGDSKSIDVSSLNSGVYLLNITSENGVATKKFIKE